LFNAEQKVDCINTVEPLFVNRHKANAILSALLFTKR